MTDSPGTAGIPRQILLATDLSARCDRALERAMLLAAGWQAQLTILHVLEERPQPAAGSAGHALPSWQRPPDPTALAKLRIRQGLRADARDAVQKAIVLVEEGDPAQVIEQTAIVGGAELIITGIAGENAFVREPVVLGKTVERLLRRSPAPILIVRDRARAPYEHILVAADLAAISGHALQAALRVFPFQTLHMLHAFEAPHAGLVSDPASYEKRYAQGVAGDLDAFLDSIFMSEAQRRRINPLIERGRPGTLISDYVRDHGADLVVLGTHGRSAMLEALIGSTAKSILSALPCDALVVRGPLARRQS